MSDIDLVNPEVAMLSQFRHSPLPRSTRAISRCRENAASGHAFAIDETPKCVSGHINYRHPIFNGDTDAQKTLSASIRPTASTGGTAESHGIGGSGTLGDHKSLERRDCCGSQGRDIDSGISASTSLADPRTPPAYTALTHPYLPPDPYAEGQHARVAGLTEDDQPYLWPPGEDAKWLAGYRSVRDFTDMKPGVVK